MSINKLNYQGDSKILKNLVNAVNALIDAGEGGSSTLSGLDDTNISNPSDGQVLGYDSSSSMWKNVDPSGGISDVQVDGTSVVTQGIANISTPDLDDLPNVNINTPTNGQVLAYDSQNDKWKNVSGGGGGGNVNDVLVNGTSVVDGLGNANITSYKEVTQAEYDALPSTKESDGVLYCIKDASPTPYPFFAIVNGAVNIIYDDGN